MKHTSRITTLIAGTFACLSVAPAAFAADSITVGNAKVERGGKATVNLHVTSSQPLTLLSVDLTFAPKLCISFRQQAVARAGRSAVDPQEGAIRCPDDGRVSIVLMDLLGKAAVPAGSGPVAQWTFDVAPTTKPGSYPVEVSVRQASNGPTNVPLATTAGNVNVLR